MALVLGFFEPLYQILEVFDHFLEIFKREFEAHGIFGSLENVMAFVEDYDAIL